MPRLFHYAWIIATVVALAAPRPVAAAEEAVTARKAVADAFDYPLAIQGPKAGAVDPPSDEELEKSIHRGVDFLIVAQRESGAWGGPQKTTGLNIYAPGMASHLAFRTGTTALAVMALCEASDLCEGERREKVDAAIDRGQAWLLEHSAELTRAEP